MLLLQKEHSVDGMFPLNALTSFDDLFSHEMTYQGN